MDGGEAGCHARRKRMTDVMTPTLNPIPLNAGKKTLATTEGCDIECLTRTILLVNPPLIRPRTHCKLAENMQGEWRKRLHTAAVILWQFQDRIIL